MSFGLHRAEIQQKYAAIYCCAFPKKGELFAACECAKMKYNLLEQGLSLGLKQNILFCNSNGTDKAGFIISVIFSIIDKTLISQ